MSEPLKGGFSSFSGGFGANTTTSTTQTPSLFGTTAGTPSTGTLGGATGGAAFAGFGAKPAGSLFGGSGSTSTSTPGGTSLFTGFGTSSAPATAPNAATPGGNAPAAGSTLFGGAPKPSEQPSAPGSGLPAFGAPKPAGPNLFNLTGNSSSSAPVAASSNGAPSTSIPSFFSKPAEPTTTPSIPAAPTGGLFGSGNLFNKPDTPSATSAPAAVTTTAPTPAAFSGFGGAFGVKKDETAQKDAATASTGALFGLAPVASKEPSAPVTDKREAPPLAEKKGAPVTSLSTFSLTGSTVTPAATSSATQTAPGSVQPPAGTNLNVPAPSMLRGKTIEEIVNKWSADLETHVREFTRLAGEVAVWDRTLIDNGNSLAALFQHVLIAEREQNDIDQSLTHVEQQQKELSAALDNYEKTAKDTFDGPGGTLRLHDVGPADAERDKNYTLAAELNTHLDDLSHSLLQMIESVNDLSETEPDGFENSKTDDPLQQIGQILSSHLDTLQWVDGAVRDVETKVRDVEKRIRESSAPTNPSSVAVSGFVSNQSRSRGFGLSR